MLAKLSTNAIVIYGTATVISSIAAAAVPSKVVHGAAATIPSTVTAAVPSKGKQADKLVEIFFDEPNPQQA